MSETKANAVLDWDALEAAIDAVLDLPAKRRSLALKKQLVHRPELLSKALQWSAALDKSEQFLERAQHTTAQIFHLKLGDTVGDWRVEDCIAVGGSSEVYKVRRIHTDYRQVAALKLLRDTTLNEQFRREQKMLARLQHPNIAHFLDGGISPEGWAYTVVEFIDGYDLPSWCRQLRPTLEQRLELFIKLCDAVSHAHAQFVVHRDIKPINISLTREGEPKLLDFGIARLQETGAQNSVTQVLFTPSYAAPELLQHLPASAQTDVYGLGAVLHFLLTHRAPWGLDKASLPQAIETILQGKAVSLSDASFDRERPFASTQIDPDLAAIVQMALALEPERRYASVAALKQDIHAHLHHFPVKARGSQRTYRFGRFLRRNLWQTVAAYTVLVSLLLALGSSIQQNRLIKQERDAALRSAERAHAVRGQLFQLLHSSEDASSGTNRQQLFENSIESLRKLYADEPLEAARVLAGFGQLYFINNDYVRAEPLLREALVLAQQGQAEPSLIAETQLDLAQVLFRVGQADESAKLLASAQQSLQQQPDRLRHDLIESRTLEAQLLRAAGKADQALSVLEAAYQELLPYAGESSSQMAVLTTNLATAYFHAKQLDEALNYFDKGWQMWQASGQTHTPDALNLLNNWGVTALRLGRVEAAQQRLQQAHELRVELFGDSAALAALKKNLAEALWLSDEKDRAVALATEATDMAAEYAGQYTPLHLGVCTFLAEFLYKQARYEAVANVLNSCWKRDDSQAALYSARAAVLEEAAAAARDRRPLNLAVFEAAKRDMKTQALHAHEIADFCEEIEHWSQKQ